MVSAHRDSGSGQEQAGDDNHRSESLQRVLLSERRQSALHALALNAASGAIRRLYGAHVEAGVGASVETCMESRLDLTTDRRPAVLVDPSVGKAQ
jgi:hypothetical protein